ncbi:hypothetical protein BC829DRAFT_383932, partial [Chytridium lagenaria]
MSLRLGFGTWSVPHTGAAGLLATASSGICSATGSSAFFGTFAASFLAAAFSAFVFFAFATVEVAGGAAGTSAVSDLKGDAAFSASI